MGGAFDFRLKMRYDLTPDLAIAYSSTLIAATVPIWIGSRVSANQKATETMSTQDAYMFPVIASFGLFGLFLAFMWFPREYINMVLTCYFLFRCGCFGYYTDSHLQPLDGHQGGECLDSSPQDPLYFQGLDQLEIYRRSFGGVWK